MTGRIEDYALIGDCETAALVGRDGSMDWLCWPRFDSPACFAALLGGPENGRWLIAPQDGTARNSRAYRQDTLILETRFETEGGEVLLTDFMPLRGTNSDVVRRVTGLQGKVAMKLELIVRFDYGQTVPWVSRLDNGSLRMIAGPNMLLLRSDVELRGEGLATVAEFEISKGETKDFVLTYAESHRRAPRSVNPQRAFDDTAHFWRNWVARCTAGDRWGGAIRRSLITLKALTYQPTGGIVAAPTSSLPEWIGGQRNWDYRFCWLRDATFALMSLMEAGYYEEAQAWRDWLTRAAAGSPVQMQIMYGLAGERDLAERTLPWLAGYEGSAPVRIGNGAAGQLQLDVFGEVADALYTARRNGLPVDDVVWAVQRAMTEHLETIWMDPDEGIWEVRSGRRHFIHSKVMAWVAMDRAVKSVEAYGLPGPIDRWRAVRDRIHAEVCERGFDAKLGSFVQTYGSKAVDASLLLIPLVGFLPVTDPRMTGTVNLIQQRLSRDGLLLRYDTGCGQDGLPEGEGVFLACSFWLADNLVLQGRDQEAEELFERLISLRNDVGLLSEEYDPVAQRMLGNFPQAFSHVALVNTALNLTRVAGPAEQRGSGKPPIA